MDANETQNEFRKLCAENGFKCTPQRFAVYACIKGNREHPSVDQVWDAVRQQVPSITRESVFRILLELAEAGTIYRMDKIINARFDGIAGNHGHLICEKCGAVTDFPLPAGIGEYPKTPGFQASHIELRISGVCKKCAAEINKTK